MSAVLAAQALQKRFGAVTAAADITLSFDTDTVASLIGANGAGKTTFLNLVTGYLKPDSGRILFGDRDIVGLSPRARSQSLAYPARSKSRNCSRRSTCATTS